MKVSELVRIDTPAHLEHHNQLGIVIDIDKSMAIWPNNRIYYDVMLENGEILKFRYEELIGSEDLYFTRDDYFSPQCKTP